MASSKINIRARSSETLFRTTVGAITGALVLMILSVLVFMAFTGFPLIRENRFLELITGSWAPHENRYGIFPMIVGTLGISSLSVALTFPVSLGCAAQIFLLGHGRTASVMRRAVLLMTGIPTVIYGFVGVFLLVPFIRELFHKGSGMCILSAAAMLAILISPTMIVFFIQSFDRVPRPWLDAACTLGASRVQILVHMILPFSSKGIVTGTILSFGRALGDTLVALMIAGNAVQVPGGILDSVRTLTAHIALVIAADFQSMEFKSIFLCGAVLYLITSSIIGAIRVLESWRPPNR
ncbi:MAG: ABC transporter permease subunit [Pseudomonadota bacterium]